MVFRANLSCGQVSSVLTSAGIGNHAARPKNGGLFPLILIPDHVYVWSITKSVARHTGVQLKEEP